MLSVVKKLFINSEKFKDPVLNKQCTEFEVDNWIISRFIVDKLIPIVGVHPFPINEQMLMIASVCRIKPTHIFEWGTNIGKSARIFYETSQAFDIDAEIHSIDLPDTIDHAEHPQHQRGKMVKGIKSVFLHHGDGLDTSLQLYKNIRERGCRPLFFLDGDHSYESVIRELSGILNNIPEAVTLIHDTFYQSPESGYNIGPSKAIEDAISSLPENKYRVISQNLGLPGMTLLWQGN